MVAWGAGENEDIYTEHFRQSIVPTGLENVVAVSAGGVHSLALKADGTVVAWGAGAGETPVSTWQQGQSIVPTGLDNVVAVAAGGFHSLALKADGTVVAWGSNSDGQRDVPADLDNVVAVSAGSRHSLALKADGTVVAWGDNSYGQCNMPAGLNLAGRLELASLQAGTFLLNPEFDPQVFSYSVAVPYGVTGLQITALLSDPTKDTLRINGEPQDNGVSYTLSLLEVGPNPVSVAVVSPATGFTRTYAVTIYRYSSGQLAVETVSLPIALKDRPYQAFLAASGGSGPYSWSASGLPAGLVMDENSGEIGGTATQTGEYAIEVTVTDSDGLTALKTLTLKVRLGTGNGAFIVTPDADPAYSGGLTDDGIVTMTVNSGVSGFKHFSVTVEPVTGHPGDEVLVFVHLRGGVQLGISTMKADFDAAALQAGASFNVRPGDVIRVYLVDDLTNDPGVNPVVL